MLNVKDIKELYEKYGVSASKRFGQNFLVDENVLSKIINVSKCKGKDVVEIGPGLGSLSHFLIPEAKSITAYEIDREMIKVLKGEINDDKFSLIEGDFLRAELDFKSRRTIVANIPYFITSDIIFKIFENADKFERATLMIQKEVAQRLDAAVGSKLYNKLTLTTKLYTENLKLEFIVKPTSFMPSPKVDSAIVTFDIKEPVENHKEIALFFKKCFMQRRKTLYNNLKKFIDPDVAKETIAKLELNESARPQELSFDKFIELFNHLYK